MNHRNKTVLLGAGLLTSGVMLSVILSTDHSPRSVPPPPLRYISLAEQQARYDGRTGDQSKASLPVAAAPQVSPSGFVKRTSEFTAEELADFAGLFKAKLQPVMRQWCAIYGSHAPFDPDRVSATNLIQRIGVRPRPYSWMFVVDGLTLSVSETDEGPIRFDYLMSKGLKPMMQVPLEPAPPLPPSVSRDEILTLIKGDSGKEYPASEIAIRPTAYGSAMNGGVSVDVGQGVHSGYGPPPDFTMVFGPDGKLVAYGRWVAPRSGRQAVRN